MCNCSRLVFATFGMLAVLAVCTFAEGESNIVAANCGVVGDGSTDVTDALQSCLDACGDRGGGIVSLPTGDYIIRGHLSIPDYVTLQGVFCAPAIWSPGKGTTLNVFEGKGSEEGPPFILLNTCSTLQGVTVYYPEQSNETVIPYPWCIAGSGGANVTVLDCLLVNPYQGIDLATHNSGRHLVSRVYGYPLRKGIRVDKCFDVGRIEDVHFWPFWESALDGNVAKFVQEQGEAFIFGRTDWQYVLNTFCFGYRAGYRFIETADGVCNGNFLGIGADSSNIAVQVDQCSPIGLQITNGEFVAFAGDNPAEVVVDGANVGTIQFGNCSFWGGAWNCARIAGKGFVSFEQCNFLEWDHGKTGEACIRASGGLLTVNACRFHQPQLAVQIQEGVTSAIVTSNFFGQRVAIQSAPGVPVEVADNVAAHEEDKPFGCVGGAMTSRDASPPKGGLVLVCFVCVALCLVRKAAPRVMKAGLQARANGA